jgi:hypothetical protein
MEESGGSFAMLARTRRSLAFLRNNKKSCVNGRNQQGRDIDG